jgi:hypothetical protein
LTDPDLVRRVRAVLTTGDEITIGRRPSFDIDRVSIEDMLQTIVDESSHGLLLHGSGGVIEPKRPLALPGFATDHGGIAILKAIFSNSPDDRDRWTYPYYVSKESPLVVKVMNPRSGFVRERGYVYLVEAGDGAFRNNPPGSWQWKAEHADIPFLGRIEVQRADFRYAVKEVEWLHEDYT